MDLELKPAENHFDSLITVASPIQKAGVWWITAKMPDGNSSQMVLWVADTVIGRKMTEPGTLYYVLTRIRVRRLQLRILNSSVASGSRPSDTEV